MSMGSLQREEGKTARGCARNVLSESLGSGMNFSRTNNHFLQESPWLPSARLLSRGRAGSGEQQEPPQEHFGVLVLPRQSWDQDRGGAALSGAKRGWCDSNNLNFGPENHGGEGGACVEAKPPEAQPEFVSFLSDPESSSRGDVGAFTPFWAGFTPFG